MRLLFAIIVCLAVVSSAPLEEDGLYHPESLGPAEDGQYREISSETPTSEDEGRYEPEALKPEDLDLYQPESLGPEEDGSYHEVSSERPADEDDGQYHAEAEPSDTVDIEAQNGLIDLNAPHSTFLDPFNYVKFDVPLSQPDTAVYTMFSGQSNPYEYVPIQVKYQKQEVPVAPLVEARFLKQQIVPGAQYVPLVQPRLLESQGVPLVQQVFPAGAFFSRPPLHGDVNVIVSK